MSNLFRAASLTHTLNDAESRAALANELERKIEEINDATGKASDAAKKPNVLWGLTRNRIDREINWYQMATRPPRTRPPHGGKPPNRKASKPKKRGPKEEVLIIEDVQNALDRIWQTKPIKKR